MKRIFLTILFVLFAVNVFGASGTCVEVDNPNLTGEATWGFIKDDRNFKVGEWVTVLCTHSGTDALDAAFAEALMARLRGKFVYRIKSWPGSTAPTDATDLELTDNDSLALLGATNGTDFIDATTTQQTLGYNGFLSVNDYIFAAEGDVWTASTSGNSVSGADFYLKFILLYGDR